jgi:hypothetical protein
VIQQPLVVQLEEPRERSGDVRLECRRGQGPPHQQRRPFTDHGGNGCYGKRGSSALEDQRVRGVRQILPRVDEGAVEIENDEATSLQHEPSGVARSHEAFCDRQR